MQFFIRLNSFHKLPDRKMAKMTFISAMLLVCGAINVRAAVAADDVEAAWQKYLVEFPIKTKSEYGIRKEIFAQTHSKITLHNSNKDVHFQMAHNAFSVMTEEEKKSHVGAVKPVPPSNITRIYSSRQLPANVDYSTDPCMPPVKSQGCGDCWAFSATAIVEFLKCKRNGVIGLDFSEQQLVDCTYGDGYNCKNGGAEETAWQYLASKGGQTYETSYPYTAVAGTCKFPSCNNAIGAQISSNAVQWIPQKDVTAMMAVLAGGKTLAIYIQLPASFFNYKSGVFVDDQCVPGYAHGMNIVGYGWGYWKFNVTLWKWEWQYIDYWIVRNSWGPGWGDAGYVRIKKGVDLCLIESIARTTNVL